MKRLLITLSTFFLLLAGNASQASILSYSAVLNGASEVSPNASTGTGSASVMIDDMLNTMTIHVMFSGLTSPTTAAHIHCCTAAALTGAAGVATMVPNFTDFPLGVQAGSYDHVFDLSMASSYNGAFVTTHGATVPSAEAAFLAALADGKTYLNIHTREFGGGEIRGFLVADGSGQVPEPGSLALLAIGTAGLAQLRRRRRGVSAAH